MKKALGKKGRVKQRKNIHAATTALHSKPEVKKTKYGLKKIYFRLGNTSTHLTFQTLGHNSSIPQ